MLKQSPVLYIKPANGTGGRGILRIERVKNSKGVFDIQGRRQDRRIIPPRRSLPPDWIPSFDNGVLVDVSSSNRGFHYVCLADVSMITACSFKRMGKASGN